MGELLRTEAANTASALFADKPPEWPGARLVLIVRNTDPELPERTFHVLVAVR